MLEHFGSRDCKTAWAGKNLANVERTIARIDYTDVRSREPFRAYNG